MADVTITPATLTDAVRAVGRARVFYSDHWDGTTDLVLAHLGDTEGDITVAENTQLSTLTLPEISGNAPVEEYVDGAAPKITLPLYLADPALRAILSPVGGSGGSGYSSRQDTRKYTLVLIPEAFFRKADGTLGAATFAKVGAVWKVNAVAITAEQQRYLDLSVWAWRGHFSKPNIAFKHGDGGKVVESVEFTVMQDFNKPEGEQLYTRGDPADVGIDIDPVV
jgi:hypothetical protein